MRPAAYVIQRTGCGRTVGIILVLIGAFVLLSYYGVLPGRVTRWWPAVVIALGLLLLIRYYWRALMQRRSKLRVIDSGSPIAALPIPRRASLAPPTAPLLIAAIGVYLLLRNLHYVNLGVLVAAVLIVIGLAVLVGGFRGGVRT